MAIIDKIYVILGPENESKLNRLCAAISHLLSYANLTSNLCLVTEDLPESMAQVERIQKEVSSYLEANLFARLYLHVVHPVSTASLEDVRLCYQYLKGATRQFDQEGFMHQEVPRLMLLPVAIPESRIDRTAFSDLLDGLKGSFLLPGLLVDRRTSPMTQDEALMSVVEKVYYGHDSSPAPYGTVTNVCCQDIIDDSCARLEYEQIRMTDPCPASPIVSGHDGGVYACMDAFHNNESLGSIFSDANVDNMMERYDVERRSHKDCLTCRGDVAQSFSHLSLPEATAHEVGALLYHVGTLNQDAENHVRAIEDFKRSLALSPKEEAESIFFRLGLSYTKTGHYGEAIDAFNRAEREYHSTYYFYFYAGLCYFEKGDYAAAAEKFLEALRLDPQPEDLVGILVYLGTSYNYLREYEKACSHLKRAREAAPMVKEIYSTLGFAYFQLKDYDRAIENLSTAVEIDPQSAVDYASLGANYRDKGDVDQAIAMFEKALELDPGLTAARENIEKLTVGLVD
jgi:tetratricopeptide (TPR) repeat protein